MVSQPLNDKVKKDPNVECKNLREMELLEPELEMMKLELNLLELEDLKLLEELRLDLLEPEEI